MFILTAATTVIGLALLCAARSVWVATRNPDLLGSRVFANFITTIIGLTGLAFLVCGFAVLF